MPQTHGTQWKLYLLFDGEFLKLLCQALFFVFNCHCEEKRTYIYIYRTYERANFVHWNGQFFV